MSRTRIWLSGVAVLLIIFLPGYSKLQELKARNRSLSEQIKVLKKDNQHLAQQIDKLQKDPLYIEKQARDKMGVAKKGEIVYKVVSEDKKTK